MVRQHLLARGPARGIESGVGARAHSSPGAPDLRNGGKERVELLILGALAFAAIVVFGVLASVFGMVLWLIFLPFRIIGWLFSAVAFVFALPFVAVFGVIALLVFGGAMLMFLVPFFPIVLLVLGAVWLVRRNQRAAAAVAR